MEQQIHQAVDIALSGTADASLKNQAYDFINQIKSTPEGYKSSVGILEKSGTQPVNEGLKFFIFQVIDENIDKLNDEQLFTLNTQLFKTLGQYIANDINDPIYLRNKFAQLFSRIFCAVYLNIYPNFLKDLLNLIATNNQNATDYYTRIIISIHYEIGDKFIARTREVQERNNLLKDQIRINDMNSLATSWGKILQNPQNSNEILNNTLKIIGQYINWMEISLFISNDFMRSIFQYLNKEDQRSETCLALIEIVSKKMKPANKLELISLLNLTTIVSSIDLSDNDELEFVENIAKLLNQVGQELLIVLENQQELVTDVNEQLLKLWPLIFSSLSHEYDDVSQQVFPFIQQYLLLCKKSQELSSLELLSTLLNKVIFKMKYDEDADGISDDDETGQFLDIRSKLKVFQDTIAVLKPDLYLEAIPIVINESLFGGNGKNADWRKIELGLFELNSFSESLRKNLINLPKNEINQSKPYLIFQEFLIKLINSDLIIEVNHPKIQTSFFEIIVQHYTFLNTQANQQQLVLRILEIFTSPLGLFNENEKVRLRSWYLFFRFVTKTKPTLNNSTFVENMVIKLQSLLVVKAELPTKDEDDDIVETGNFNNQLYLFESVGLLVSLLNADSADHKLKLIDLVFQPIFNDLENCVSSSDQDKLTQPLIALQAHHSLMAIGTFARGYDHDLQNKYSEEIRSKINNAAQVVLITLENFPKHEKIRDAARFAFARFIPILKNQINVHLTKLITLILAANDLRTSELSDFLSFLGQIAHNYKDDNNIYQLLNNLLTPVINKVFEILSNTTSDEQLMPDIIRDKYDLKKAYMNFIGSLFLNHSASLLITETNKRKFPEIVTSLLEYAYDLGEPTASKLAITQLINIINVFGNGGKIHDPEDSYGSNLPAVEGIDEFLMNKVTQLSFELPFQKQEFDLKDAQYRSIGQEISLMLKTYEQRNGDEFLNYLSVYLTNMGLSQQLMNEFGSNLVKLDSRNFKKYFITFVIQLKGNK
ncbi:armadillo-type protein [Scheffersomyces xylosifermentans]|uniref:armadillo-type protein n=1 Tax=Scheffersomyces xylosifermentans TaxID=1304137 RepID=UPI00315CF8D5